MPLNESDIAHLIRRTEFFATEKRIDELKNHPSIKSAVDAIVTKNVNSSSPKPGGVTLPFWFDDASQPWAYVAEMRRWWIDQMAFGAQPLKEKMTLFWHGHFTSASGSTQWYTDVIEQNQLYRVKAFGDFQKLAMAMSLEPLMLRYLDNATNTKTKRNENFARELMELFLLGLNHYDLISGQAWPYTQEDVVAASKAWTGYNLPWVQGGRPVYRYRPEHHDDSIFTLLGQTGKFNGGQVIGRILNEEPYRTISARHIASRMWSFFAYPDPADSLVAELVNDSNFSNSWNIESLLRIILCHPEFYTQKAKTGLISTPAEFTTRIFKIFGIGLNTSHNSWGVRDMKEMGQELFDPPNVAGWKANGYWLSTSQLGARGNVLKREFYSDVSKTKFVDLDFVEPNAAVKIAARRIGLVDLQQPTISHIASFLTDERVRPGSTATFRSSSLMHLLIMSPDFQLS